MSLRLRLALAFFTLSVVPLGAITFYSYTTNVEALRVAAEREADLLAGELGQRMQLVTAQLSERVEHLMDIAELQSAADAAAAKTSPSESTATSPAAKGSEKAVLSDSIAKTLGDSAMLLNNVQLENLRGFGGSRGRGGAPPRGGPPPQDEGPPPLDAERAPRDGGTSPRIPRQNPNQEADPDRPPGPPPGGGGRPSTTRPTILPTLDDRGNLVIDLGPLRRNLLRQGLPPGRKLEDLSPEEKQQLAAKMNRRIVGFEQFFVEQRQKQPVQVQKDTDPKNADPKGTEKKAPAASSASADSAGKTQQLSSDLKRRSAISGSSIAVKVERNGEVVRSMNAEINLPNVLATVFSTTQRDRGELPFAVAKDGTIYTRTEADQARVAAFGSVAKPDGPAMVRLPDWIVVTTRDNSGSELRLGIARPVSNSLADLRRTTARNGALGLMFIVLALVGIVPLSTRLTRNLSALNVGVGRIAKGDYHARVPVKSKDEVGQLAIAFNEMAADVERHHQTAVEQERIRSELELGRQIQNEMLPRAPLVTGAFHVNGISVPAREVGGDFFNYFVLAGGNIALLMGDVSGKGVGAALLMANIQAALKIRLELGQELAAVVEAIDRDIGSNSPGPMYATLFVAMLEPATRRLRYVNAGHDPQYIRRKEGTLERMHATGLPTGLLAGHGYFEESVQLAEGDQLFLYTDGCVEAENEHGEPFGVERLEALLLDTPLSVDPLHAVGEAIAAFRGKVEPPDDMTLMAVTGMERCAE